MSEKPDNEIPTYTDVPIAIDATGSRSEFDSLGHVDVPADKYWGAQTQRSLQHFSIGDDHMPIGVYRAYGLVKKACAMVNEQAGRLEPWRAKAIIQAADEAIAGKLDDQFPLYVWQTGSGTQSNMNVNEVLSNRAIQLLGGELGSQQPVGPNDHVNMGQSSNDTFPTAMHIAAVTAIDDALIPSVTALNGEIAAKSAEWMKIVKIGRTHLEDAVPLTVGQEWSGYAAQLEACLADVEHARQGLLDLAVGGTAVGTGLNAPKGFGVNVASTLAEQVRGRWLARPDGARPCGTARPGRDTDEDRQRHAVAGLRPTVRSWRIAAPCQ